MRLTLEALKTVIDEAHAAGLYVRVSVHTAPPSTMFDWLERGLIGPIGQGYDGNPPTSNVESRAAAGRRPLELTVFMDRHAVSPPEPEPTDELKLGDRVDLDAGPNGAEVVAVEEAAEGYVVLITTEGHRFPAPVSTVENVRRFDGERWNAIDYKP